MAGSIDLFAAAEQFFDLCRVALADTPDGVPECAYLSPGPPPWDACPCLIVHIGGPVVADTLPLQPALAPAHRIATFGEVNMVAITATILRCTPTIDEGGRLPSPAEFNAATRQTSCDLWAIWNHVAQAKRDGALFPPRERELLIEPSVALNQQGGAAGWQFTLRTQLDGYRPV